MPMIPCLALSMAAAIPAQAQTIETVTVTEWVEDGAERFVSGTAGLSLQGEAFGPFRVLDGTRAALVDTTDSSTPRQFAAMIARYPGIATIEMVECPGTEDDSANLALGRMIRARRIATHVPAGGSVRSGAVELFLAGATRRIDDGAEFAVHSWRDSDGREAGDIAADASPNLAYVNYYREMGLPRPQAFYDMINAVPNADARWLTAQDMRIWLGESRDGAVTASAPADAASIAYLDLGNRFP